MMAAAARSSTPERAGPIAALLATFAVILCVPPAAADDGADLSEANALLFESSHLRGLEAPAQLRYRLESSGSEQEEAFTDEVVLHVRPNPDAPNWHVEFDYLAGERERPVPPVSSATGNPVIKVFLQREVVEMERRTGGNWRYFQKAIKRALQDAANVERTRFDYRGQSVEGRRIRIAPYRDDPRRGQMGVYAQMRYVVVLSDAVPGRVYELTARVQSGDGSGEPAFAETLRLVQVERESGQ